MKSASILNKLNQRLGSVHHVYLGATEADRLREEISGLRFRGLHVEVFFNSDGSNRIIENRFVLTGDGCLMHVELEGDE